MYKPTVVIVMITSFIQLPTYWAIFKVHLRSGTLFLEMLNHLSVDPLITRFGEIYSKKVTGSLVLMTVFYGGFPLHKEYTVRLQI